MIWAQSELPRRSWFIIKLWNSLLWREEGGRHSNGDILLLSTLWKVEYMLWVSPALACMNKLIYIFCMIISHTHDFLKLGVTNCKPSEYKK
jgi:hypothetical protein